MRICVLIPNQDWLKTAGVRIRYKRMIPTLEALGHSLDLLPIDTLHPSKIGAYDTYLFCKCHDARAVMLARRMQALGRRVGVDFFDDYYSQFADSRFVHLRRWFRQITPHLNFAMCATPNMAARLARLVPDLPCHILNDPYSSLDAKAIGRTVDRNAARALATGQLRIGWFGIGDNPHFSLGLDDLTAFAPMLAQARGLGFDLHLDILTNARALTPERLSALARLPVPFTLEEWTEARETALIRDSLACFLPVNGQGFSVVKSLNRGVTTLTGGAQLLSAGFPLYAPLGDFVYRDLSALIDDLKAGALKLRGDTAPKLEALLAETGDPQAEAERQMDFLTGIAPPDPAPWPHPDHPVALIHGMYSTGDIHKTAQRLGCLSVASPLFSQKLNFDLKVPVFRRSASTVTVILSQRAHKQLVPDLAAQAKARDRGDGKPEYTLVLHSEALPGLPSAPPPPSPRGTGTDIATFNHRIDLTRALLKQLFGDCDTILSEMRSPSWSLTERSALPEPIATGEPA